KAAAMGRQRRRARRRAWGVWTRPGSEVAALVVTALVGVIAALGWLADMVAGASPWWRLVLFAAGVLALGMGAVTLLRGWLAARRWLARRAAALPAGAALAVAGLALWLASGPAFHARLTSLRMLVGGRAETERLTLAHQVYAAYRRADLAALARVLERARVYEPTVLEAAAGFGVDAEVLMGVGAAESAFYPRDSAGGGRGLFQITAPPAEAVAEVRRRLGVAELDPLNQRHNAFAAAATLRRYLDEMRGDLFLGFTNLGEIKYFAHVIDFLETRSRALGLRAEIHVVRTHPTASLPQRAVRVLETIGETMGREGAVHVIGHSSGGLDARLLVAPGVSLPSDASVERVARRVATVITVATPPHGTPLASFFASPLGPPPLRSLSLR